MTILLVALIGFLIGGFLFRRRDPNAGARRTSIIPCPYCRKPSEARIGSDGPEITCKNCGTFSNRDLEDEGIP